MAEWRVQGEVRHTRLFTLHPPTLHPLSPSPLPAMRQGIAQPSQPFLALAPVLPDLNPQLQVDLAADHFLDLDACGLADLLDTLAILAQNDLLL